MEKAKIFLLGMLAAAGLLLLLGTGGGGGEVGRYQIAAWGAARGDSYRSGYYVLDTRTGKIVDQAAQ
ncbi:MAG: hypothetical protein Kow0092_25010 [Deferrisomatales bacterium]